MEIVLRMPSIEQWIHFPAMSVIRSFEQAKCGVEFCGFHAIRIVFRSNFEKESIQIWKTL